MATFQRRWLISLPPGSLQTTATRRIRRWEVSDPGYAAEMNLPPGKTCSDCAHFKRCSWLISAEPERTYCDWHPSRFRLSVVAHTVTREGKGET